MPGSQSKILSAALLALSGALVPWSLCAKNFPGIFVETPPASGQPSAPPIGSTPSPQATPQATPPEKKPAAATKPKAKKNPTVSALPPDDAAEKPAAPKPAATTTKTASQGIAVLVNDEPITAYEIQQRASFFAMTSGGGGSDFKAKA